MLFSTLKNNLFSLPSFPSLLPSLPAAASASQAQSKTCIVS